MAKKGISVIIPVHNGAKTLRPCLESVLKQSLKPLEVIVVDNRSSDDTAKIIKEFQKRHVPLRYVYEERRSRGRARNAGIKCARGDIIAMTDVDCIVPVEWLRELTLPLMQGREKIVMGYEEDVIGNFWTKNIHEANWLFYEKNRVGDYIKILDTKNFAISTALMKSIMFDSRMGNLEDFDFSLKIRNQQRILFLPDLKVKHYHKASLFKWIRLCFERGFWAMKIYQKHKARKFAELEPMFESIKIGNLLSFPLWMAYQFIKSPSRKQIYVLVSELSWRLGLLHGYAFKG